MFAPTFCFDSQGIAIMIFSARYTLPMPNVRNIAYVATITNLREFF